VIRIHWNLTVIQFATEQIAEEVQELCALDEHSLHSYHPSGHIIDDSDVEELVQELLEKGYTPRVEDCSE